jgi:hypothetical protein
VTPRRRAAKPRRITGAAASRCRQIPDADPDTPRWSAHRIKVIAACATTLMVLPLSGALAATYVVGSLADTGANSLREGLVGDSVYDNLISENLVSGNVEDGISMQDVQFGSQHRVQKITVLR